MIQSVPSEGCTSRALGKQLRGHRSRGGTWKLHNGFYFEEIRGEDEKSRSGFFPGISSRCHGCSLGSKYLLLKLDQDLPSLGPAMAKQELTAFSQLRAGELPSHGSPWERLECSPSAEQGRIWAEPVLCIQKSCCDGKLDEGEPSLENPPAAHKDGGYQVQDPTGLGSA